MKIYLDIIFMINLIYDFLILNTVNIVLNRFIKVKRLFISSLIGTFLTIILIKYNNILLLILFSIFMILIAFGYKDFIYLKNNVLYFYMISAIFGGFIYMINLRFNHYYNQNDYYNFKILINFIGIIMLSPIIYFLYLYTYKNNNIKHKNYYSLLVSINNKVHEVNAFYDTGNLVKDPYKGRPIILIEKDVLYGDIKNKSPIYVPCNMVNNEILIKCYKPNLLIINNIVINNCLIGLFESKMYDGVKAIISGYIGDKIK